MNFTDRFCLRAIACILFMKLCLSGLHLYQGSKLFDEMAVHVEKILEQKEIKFEINDIKRR